MSTTNGPNATLMPHISAFLDVDDVFEPGGEKMAGIGTESHLVPNVRRLREHLVGQGRLTSALTLRIVELTRRALSVEPNVLTLPAPVNIVGDIHGQFYDLLSVFALGGSPDKCAYLFLGDFVDRGLFAYECVCYLFCVKLRYPHAVHLLRGNHESRHLTQFFTFHTECLVKASEQVYDRFMDAFDALPLAAIVDGKFFCVHGGLSPSLRRIKDIEALNRFRELPKSGLMCDLVWSDPVEHFDKHRKSRKHRTTRKPHRRRKPKDGGVNDPDADDYSDFDDESSESEEDDQWTTTRRRNRAAFFEHNANRGCSYSYTFEAVEAFLRDNGLLCMIRAHQVQREGIHLSRCLAAAITTLATATTTSSSIVSNESSLSSSSSSSSSTSSSKSPDSMFPALITVFSAPNYCDVYHNKAAIIQYTGKMLDVKLFTAARHPFVLANFQDAFAWSMPFILEKLCEMLAFFLNQVADEEADNEIDDDDDDIEDNSNENARELIDATVRQRGKKEETNHTGTDREKTASVTKRIGNDNGNGNAVSGSGSGSGNGEFNFRHILNRFRERDQHSVLELERERVLSRRASTVRDQCDAHKARNELANADLKLGALTPSTRVRRRSSVAQRDLLVDLEKKGVDSFEDASQLDALQYKIINSSDGSDGNDNDANENVNEQISNSNEKP